MFRLGYVDPSSPLCPSLQGHHRIYATTLMAIIVKNSFEE
jgi:hypothetical protein